MSQLSEARLVTDEAIKNSPRALVVYNPDSSKDELRVLIMHTHVGANLEKSNVRGYIKTLKVRYSDGKQLQREFVDEAENVKNISSASEIERIVKSQTKPSDHTLISVKTSVLINYLVNYTDERKMYLIKWDNSAEKYVGAEVGSKTMSKVIS